MKLIEKSCFFFFFFKFQRQNISHIYENIKLICLEIYYICVAFKMKGMLKSVCNTNIYLYTHTHI